jgi:hypothetical protein
MDRDKILNLYNQHIRIEMTEPILEKHGSAVMVIPHHACHQNLNKYAKIPRNRFLRIFYVVY